MTEITITLDHLNRTYVIRFNVRTRDDDDIIRFSEKLQALVFKVLDRDKPSFEGPVPSIAFAHWLNLQLAGVHGIESIVVGRVTGISAILRDAVPVTLIAKNGDCSLSH